MAACLVALESLDLLLAKLSLRRSLCSFNLEARSFWYSAASDFALAILFFLSAILALFLWRVRGVTRRWILGALLTFFPVTKICQPIITTTSISFQKIISYINRPSAKINLPKHAKARGLKRMRSDYS